MGKIPKTTKEPSVYLAPQLFVLTFYGLLIAWTVISISLIIAKNFSAPWPIGQLVMIGFVMSYTWYWCLGIAYRIVVSDSGDIELKSLRGNMLLKPTDVYVVESPRIYVIPTVFVRFRLARGRAYVFSIVNSVDLKNVFQVMHKNNKDLHFKGYAGVV
jgi:hypothetical protein